MKRFWEIDTLRGIAVVLMALFHLYFNLNNFGLVQLDMNTGFWWIFPRTIAGTFLLLVGISLTISYHKGRKKIPHDELTKKFLFRGLKLITAGGIITLVTALLLGTERFVLFGILHLIGLCIILVIPLLNFTWLNLLGGILIFTAGFFLGELRFDFFWLLWLGFRPTNYYPVDYLPLLPWSSFVLFGMFTGNLIYKEEKPKLQLPDLSSLPPVKGLAFLGRHSLVIYLAHHPVLFGLAYILALLKG